MSLVRGLTYPFRGLVFVYAKHPRLIRYTLAQIAVSVAVALVVLAAALLGWGPLSRWIWSRPAHGWLVGLWYAYRVLSALALLAVSYVAFVVGVSATTAPFNSKLSRHVEELRTGTPPRQETVLEDVRGAARDVRIALGKITLYLSSMAPLVVLEFFLPGIGHLLLLAAGAVLTVLYLALDYLDWPLSRHGLGVAARLAYLRRHAGPIVGFGIGTLLLLSIPVLSFLLAPAAVAGGTLLFLDLEQPPVQPRPAGAKRMN